MTTIVVIVFIIGYAMIAFEQPLRINKAATALLTGVICWSLLAFSGKSQEVLGDQLAGHLSGIAGILFFLLGAMVIVELIDAHDGFEIIRQKIRTTNGRKLVWVIGFISFFLSAALDNLTTAIVMVSLVRKLVPSHKDRLLFAGLIVIAANAGGAWSPIGDVTTTMLWLGGQVTALNIIKITFLPSLVCFLIPAWIIGRQIRTEVVNDLESETKLNSTPKERNAVFFTGLVCLLFVPVFKTLTGLPPYMGILFGLGLMWVITEIIHSGKDESEKGLLSVNHALRKIDTPSILFFLGILLSVAALEVTGTLESVAHSLGNTIGNIKITTILIGLFSAVVDNVPLVAASQGMFSMQDYPTDHYFWEFLAYCAGTGGSILIIGSAAGVAAMGMERIPFFWYLKKIGWLAFIGYLAGAGVFLLQHYLIG